MRKVRWMLFTIAVAATVAGALAFKAKYSLEEFCVAAPSWGWGGPTCVGLAGDIVTCEDWTMGKTTDWPDGTLWCYRTPDPVLWCDFTNCPQLSYMTDTE